MEGIFREMKPICPRCKSWEYCRFRFLNNKRRCKKLQPRYICRRCNKYFTLGGKLYNTSLHDSPSKAPILPNSCQSNFAARVLPNRCPSNFAAASPLYMSSRDQYRARHTSKGFCRRNLCPLNFVNPCNNINSGSNECHGMGSAHDGGSSDICYTTCDSHSGAEFIPITFGDNSGEDAMAPNLGFSHYVNDISPLNNVEPVEPLERSQERDLDNGLFLSEDQYVAENAVSGISVAGEKQREEEHIAEHSTNFLGGEDLVLHSEMDNIFRAGSCDPEEENEWLRDIFPKEGESTENIGDSTGRGSELEDSEGCLRLELFDSNLLEIPTNAGFDAYHVDAFEEVCNVDDFENIWMF